MTFIQSDSISVSTDSTELILSAQTLADKLSLPFTTLSNQHIQLVVTQQKIEIRAPNLGSAIFVDFVAGKNAHRRQFGGGRGQPLAKAIGLKKGATPTIIDATAGFARDAFVLANLGCHITLLERNPLLAILIEDAINRGLNDPDINDVINHMSVINCDAIDYLKTLNQQPDVIYIDPMYPRRDKSALVKKDMQLLHQLVGPDTDSEQLLNAARKCATKRVVIKRPKSAPHLADQQPDTRIESKNTRYDIYLNNTL